MPWCLVVLILAYYLFMASEVQHLKERSTVVPLNVLLVKVGCHLSDLAGRNSLGPMHALRGLNHKRLLTGLTCFTLVNNVLGFWGIYGVGECLCTVNENFFCSLQ